jgi:hypothetical protein
VSRFLRAVSRQKARRVHSVRTEGTDRPQGRRRVINDSDTRDYRLMRETRRDDDGRRARGRVRTVCVRLLDSLSDSARLASSDTKEMLLRVTDDGHDVLLSSGWYKEGEEIGQETINSPRREPDDACPETSDDRCPPLLKTLLSLPSWNTSHTS